MPNRPFMFHLAEFLAPLFPRKISGTDTSYHLVVSVISRQRGGIWYGEDQEKSAVVCRRKTLDHRGEYRKGQVREKCEENEGGEKERESGKRKVEWDMDTYEHLWQSRGRLRHAEIESSVRRDSERVREKRKKMENKRWENKETRERERRNGMERERDLKKKHETKPKVDTFAKLVQTWALEVS